MESQLFDDVYAAVAGMVPAGVKQVAASISERVQNLTQPLIDPVLDQLDPYLDQYVYNTFSDIQSELNSRLGDYEAWEIAVAFMILGVLAAILYYLIDSALEKLMQAASLKNLFNAIRALPPVRAYLEKEKAKMREGLLKKRPASTATERLQTLPQQGTPVQELLVKMKARAADDVKLNDRQSRLSGAVYFKSESHKALLDEVYAANSYSNPLHPDVFPSVRQMEAEVVAMTAALLGGGPEGNKSVCGAMTSGGTESILSAIKASRDYVRATRGVTQPEMIVAQSAHAAYWKAAEYFNIKLHVVRVGKDLRLSAAAVKRHLNSNTAVVVASAPGFPHGVIDHVADIARLTRRAGACLHVDACLGGFYLPFARMLGAAVPPFDFRVPGVTSISVDTHKFGMGHKGTSVVLYASPEIRQHQYTQVTDWTGGLYISPGIAGSRPGALIATAWASMVHLGLDGYLAVTRDIMAATAAFVTGIKTQLPELAVLGEPDMSVVAFGSKDKALNIYRLNDLMTQRGWHFNALQAPAALHFCFTAMNTGVVPAMLDDLRAVIDALRAEAAAEDKAGGGKSKSKKEEEAGGSAPVYGMANVSPDRGLLGEFLTAYQDTMLVP